jgi:hypothetical protein
MKAGNVPFGEGMVDLAGLVDDLRSSSFSGWILGEGGGKIRSCATTWSGGSALPSSSGVSRVMNVC